MLKLIPLIIICLLFSPVSLIAQTYKFDYNQTPRLCVNLKFLDAKFGGQYNGLGVGIEPVVNMGKNLRLLACFDLPYIDGKYKTMNSSRNNTNELKKFYKLGAAAEFAVVNWTDYSNEKVTLREEDAGGGWRRRYYESVLVEYRNQIALRGGLEQFRYILELNRYNAEMKDGDPILMINNRRLSEYDAVANWKLNSLYFGLSYSKVFSSFVEVSGKSARFSETFTWYADYILPLSSAIETLKLGGNEYDLNPFVKKSNWGIKVGVMRTTEGFVKIEAGIMPGVKAGYYIDMGLGYPLKLLKRKS